MRREGKREGRERERRERKGEREERERERESQRELLLLNRLRIESVEQLPVFSNRASHSVIIEATLYHGEKALCPSITTTAKILDQTLHWKEILNFSIAKKNVPRSAKVLLIVTEAVLRKDSIGVKKSPKFLFWGLTTIFDHQ